MIGLIGSLIGQLFSGSGFWNPVIWLIAFLVIDVIVYLLWKIGEGDYTPESEGKMPFLSGNPEISKKMSHVKADNIYWGLKEALHPYYESMDHMHTGRASDYILWFIGVTVALFIFLVR